MKKQQWKVRQAIGLRRASHRRNISVQQADRMRDRADRLMREAKRDKERIDRMR
jgi:hypothetical protein